MASLPFVHILLPLIQLGHRGGWSLIQAGNGWEVGYTWQGQHTETNNHPRYDLRSIYSNHLTSWSLDCGRKLKYPENTQTYTGLTCKLSAPRVSEVTFCKHTERHCEHSLLSLLLFWDLCKRTVEGRNGIRNALMEMVYHPWLWFYLLVSCVEACTTLKTKETP